MLQSISIFHTIHIIPVNFSHYMSFGITHNCRHFGPSNSISGQFRRNCRYIICLCSFLQRAVLGSWDVCWKLLNKKFPLFDFFCLLVSLLVGWLVVPSFTRSCIDILNMFYGWHGTWRKFKTNKFQLLSDFILTGIYLNCKNHIRWFFFF